MPFSRSVYISFKIILDIYYVLRAEFCPSPILSVGGALLSSVSIFGGRVFRRLLRLNEIIEWIPSPIGLVALS